MILEWGVPGGLVKYDDSPWVETVEVMGSLGVWVVVVVLDMYCLPEEVLKQVGGG